MPHPVHPDSDTASRAVEPSNDLPARSRISRARRRIARGRGTALLIVGAGAAAVAAACSDPSMSYGPGAGAFAPGHDAGADTGAGSGSGVDAGASGHAAADAGTSPPSPTGDAGGGDAGGPPPAAPGAVQAFKNSFYAFAVTNCGMCHGNTQSPAFAVSNVSAAYINAKPFANFAVPASSLLVQYAGNGHCGLSNCADNSAPALAALKVWAAAEMQAAPPAPPRPLVSDLDTLRLVQTDMAAQPAGARAYLRYFTLEAWGNTGNQPTLVPTAVAQAAIIKMINFLSTGPNIVQPHAIDPYKLIYRVDMRTVNWTEGAWTNIKSIDPYFAPSAFPTSLAAAASQTARADWFVTNIPNSAINAYFEFLGIDSDDPTIDARNNVNRFADMAKGAPATVRVGLPVSNTETFNRILSWHATTSLGSGAIGSGYLFKSYNMGSDVGVEDIFAHPYEPTTNNPEYPVTAADPNPQPGPDDFHFFDSDNIFSLPNGLNGYYTTECQEGAFQGQVQTMANTGAGFPGPTFCFQCHDFVTNIVPFVDHMHASLVASPPGAFPPALLTLLEGMYDEQAMQGLAAAAGATFAVAYAKLDLPVSETPGTDTESTNIVTDNYTVVLGITTAAAEMGVTPAQLISAIDGDVTLEPSLGSLVTVDSSGNPNGVIRRDAWEASYAAVRELLFPELP